MQLNSKQSDALQSSTNTLANAADLIATVIKNVAGEDIASSLNGSDLQRAVVAEMACQAMVKEIAAKASV